MGYIAARNVPHYPTLYGSSLVVVLLEVVQAHDLLLASGTRVAHQVVGPDHRCCPYYLLGGQRHDDEPPFGERPDVRLWHPLHHVHVCLRQIEVGHDVALHSLDRSEHRDALLAVLVLNVVEAAASSLPILLVT